MCRSQDFAEIEALLIWYNYVAVCDCDIDAILNFSILIIEEEKKVNILLNHD